MVARGASARVRARNGDGRPPLDGGLLGHLAMVVCLKKIKRKNMRHVRT